MKKPAKAAAVLLLSATLVAGSLLPAGALTYRGSESYQSGRYYTALTAVTLTGDAREDIVRVATSQIGYQESSSPGQLSGTVRGSGNYTEYGRWYGMQNLWCAMFVSFCASVSGISSEVIPMSASTVSMLDTFLDAGLAHSRAEVAAGRYTPQKGDIIFFRSDRNGNKTNHVGIVTGYSGSTIRTVEGNTSSAEISTDGGAVCAKSYSIQNPFIVYICSPRYPEPPTKTPLLRTGAKGEAVRSLQVALNRFGAGLTVDGEFGPATRAAVITFQKAHGLDADGVVGPCTWNALGSGGEVAGAGGGAATAAGVPVLRQGATGIRVQALQHLLNYHTGAELTVDGEFGPATRATVIGFQKANGLDADGIVGAKTWEKLTAKEQNTAQYAKDLTRAIQVLLNEKNAAGLTVDGIYGRGTEAAVRAFQKKIGTAETGAVTPVLFCDLLR